MCVKSKDHLLDVYTEIKHIGIKLISPILNIDFSHKRLLYSLILTIDLNMLNEIKQRMTKMDKNGFWQLDLPFIDNKKWDGTISDGTNMYWKQSWF